MNPFKLNSSSELMVISGVPFKGRITNSLFLSMITLPSFIALYVLWEDGNFLVIYLQAVGSPTCAMPGTQSVVHPAIAFIY